MWFLVAIVAIATAAGLYFYPNEARTLVQLAAAKAKAGVEAVMARFRK